MSAVRTRELERPARQNTNAHRHMTIEHGRAHVERRLNQATLWLFVLTVYAMLLAASASDLSDSSVSYWISGAIAVVGSFLLAAFSGFPPGFYGLKWGWVKRSLGHALVSVIALSAAGFAALTIFQELGRVPSSLPLFETRIPPEMLAYVLLSAPLQEFVFRGVFQSSIRYILGRRRGAVALAVCFSTLAYAASHLPWGIDTAICMVVPGLVWGWQYERDRTLLGVVLAHMAVGYLFVAATPLWAVLVS